MKKYILLPLLFFSTLLLSQENSNEFTYQEFIGYVKKYHPLVKQANLKITEGEAKLMKARGNFDPKIEADFIEKEYEDKNYFSVFNSSFKIPTWYGIEIKAAFDNNEGIYINPENTLPNSGLTSVGISVPLGQGLWINERMAELKQAKIYQSVANAEQKLMATEVLFNASMSYINWKRSFEEVKLYENYLENAQIRFNGIVKSIEYGDKPTIDSVEAGITVKSRKLNLENAKLKLMKASLELATYLWTENNIPLELGEKLYPEEKLEDSILFLLNLTNLEEISIENHPKINALEGKLNILKVNQRLFANKLLPTIDVNYNYLSEPSAFDNYRFEDYKVGLNFSFPLFLRKERANLKLAKIQVQDSEFGLDFERLNIENKINAHKQEITSIENQISINSGLVKDYESMLNAEERLFEAGESSLFLINSRENSLVSAKLSQIALKNSFLAASLGLFRTLGQPQ